MKVDAETVAKEMRRARASNGEQLFRVSEFLIDQQVASFFSRTARQPNIVAKFENCTLHCEICVFVYTEGILFGNGNKYISAFLVKL